MNQSDINKERLFPKFQIFQFYIYKLHEYVYWHCFIDYCVKLSFVNETLCKKWLSFHKEMVSAKFLWGKMLLGEKLQMDFESALYLTSGSRDATDNRISG